MGKIFIIIASVLFGILPSIQKHVLTSGVTPITLVILCNGTACILALAVCIVRRQSLRVNKKELLWLVFIGAIGLFFTDYLLDIAYTMIPVGYVTMIHFLYPAMVCVAMSLIFKEKMNKNKIIAIICSVAGLVLLAGGSFTGSAWGILVALATAFSYVIYMIATDKTAAADVDSMVRVFYTNAVAVICGFIFSIKQGLVFPNTVVTWSETLLVGLMLFMATYLINLGIKKIGAGTASFINMVEPVTSLIVSIIAYNDSVTVLGIIGCVLILVSVLFAALNDRKKTCVTGDGSI